MRTTFVVIPYVSDPGEQLERLCFAANAAGIPAAERQLWVMGKPTDDEKVLYQHANVQAVRWMTEPCDWGHAKEDQLAWLLGLVQQEEPELILFPTGFRGMELATRLAVQMKAVMGGDVIAFESLGNSIRFQRSVYSQNLTGTFLAKKTPLVLTVSVNAVLQPEECASDPVEDVKEVTFSPTGSARFLEHNVMIGEQGIASARRLVVAGRGVRPEDLPLIRTFAEKIGAQWGVTRPVFTDGRAGHDRVVGMSGHLTKPEIVFVFGASGAAAFVAGIQNAERIVAVNNDPMARIFGFSDVGLVADYRDILPNLINHVEKGERRA